MKKHLMNLLALTALVATLLSPLSPAHGELSNSEALNRAYELIQEQLGYPAASLTFNQRGYDKNDFFFSFTLNAAPETYDGLVTVTLDRNGNLVDYKDIEPIPVNTQIQNTLRKIRTVDEFAALKDKWGAIVAAMPMLPEPGAAEVDHLEARRMIDSKYKALLSLDIARPQGDALTEAEAVKMAYQAVAALPGLSSETAEYFRVYMAVYMHEPQTGKPVYRFLLARHSQSEPEFSSDAVYNAYERRLFNAFTGDNAGTPCYFRITLDAHTGEPVEPVFTQYPASGNPGAVGIFLMH